VAMASPHGSRRYVGRLSRRWLLVAAALIVGVSYPFVASPIHAAAYICNGGNTKYTYGPNGSQGDLSYVYNGNYYQCGYIYYIAETRNGWYNSVSYVSVNDFRTWVCGRFTGLDESYTLYNTNYNYLESPDYFYGNCGPQSDFHPAEGVYGQWGWSGYLNW